MNVNRLDPQISIGSTKITWVPRFVDHDSNAFYKGKVLTAAEYNDALLQLIYQGNYISDSLVEILDRLPDLYMLSSTKYGANLTASGTAVQLLDQDGNALGDPITTQDTGATSTAITGSGNAFTNVAYDATTRELTFTKGDVFVKVDNFDTYFDARVDSALATDSNNPVQNGVIAQLIPEAASSSNKLADKSYVASTTLPSSTKYAAGIALSMDSSTYVVTAQLKDQDGNNIGDSKTVDLPLESVVVSGAYDSTNKKVILTLKSGSTIDFSVADLVSDLVSSSRTIAGVDLADNITKSELLTALNVADGAQVNTVNSVNAKTGAVTLNYSDVGAVPSNSETSTYTSYIKNDNSKIALYQQANNGVSGYTQPDDRIEVDQNGVIITSEEGHSNFTDYSKSILTSFDGKVRYKKSQFNYVEGEFRHEEEVLKNGEIATTDEVAVKEDKATIEAYTIASNSWTSLASSEPFKFSTTVTATYTIGNDTEVGIINDQAVLFANYGFIVGSVSGQSVTIYSIAQPDTSVTLKVGYRG